jgi:hypothetical protein
LPAICTHMCSVAYVSGQAGLPNAGHSGDDKAGHAG